MYVFATPLESLICIYVYMICNMYEIYLWWCIHKSKKVPKYMQAWTISGWMDGSFGNKVAEFVLARQFRLRAGVEARNNIVNQAGLGVGRSCPNCCVDWLQNFEGLPTDLPYFCKSVITIIWCQRHIIKPAHGIPGFLDVCCVLQCLIRMFMWPLTVWNVGWGAWCIRESRELGRQKCLGLSCWNANHHGLAAFSGFYPTTSFFKESHTFQMSDKATDKWKNPTNAMLGLGCALVHCVGRFRQPEALLPAWPLVLLMLSTMLGVWKPGGFEHDFSGTSWEGFKDDCDTMKFTRSQIWRTKSIIKVFKAVKSWTSSGMLCGT